MLYLAEQEVGNHSEETQPALSHFLSEKVLGHLNGSAQ